jgi:superfamily II DNA or RNA helicase
MDNVVRVTLRDVLNIRVETDDDEYIKLLRGCFTYYVPNFRFTPQYKSGGWNGKTCMIRSDNSMPYGLLTELLRVNKKEFPRITTIVENDVKALFQGEQLKVKQNLSLKPYPYQMDCIQKALKYTRGVVRSSVASGKSCIISYVIKTVMENDIVEHTILVVPNKSLVEQFYNDMNEYGMSKWWSIGRVYTKYKEWDRDIVISTWQSLIRNKDKLKNYDCVIVDECHLVTGFSLSKILVNASRAKYRLGFTGTLHSDKLDILNTCSYLGPIIADYSSNELAEMGYVAKCTVNIVNIEYAQDYNGTYDEVKDAVFTNSYRLNVAKTIINKLDHNVLILVGKVEKEGDFLKEWLKDVISKEIVFISGRDSVDVREKWRKECMVRKDIALIATYPLFSQGINIPNLQYVMFGSPFMSKIRVLQSIGRALRKHADKKKGAFIYDIFDHTKFLEKHGNTRYRYYGSEGFEIKEVMLEEGDSIILD